MSAIYEVQTDLDPEQLTMVAAATYRQWLSFALGGESIGGQTLAHPSGRYAASISWKRTGVASIAIIADEKVAPEALWIEEGQSGADMKAAMLGGGATHVDKQGYQYRAIPIRKDGVIPKGADAATIVNNGRGGERLSARIGKLWAKPLPNVNADHWAMMTDKPNSSSWRIPAMPAYAPAKLLADLLRIEYGQ